MSRSSILVALILAAFTLASRADVTTPSANDQAAFSAYVADQFALSFDGSVATVKSPDKIQLILPATSFRQPFTFATFGIKDTFGDVVTVPPSYQSSQSSKSPSVEVNISRLHDACIQLPVACAEAITQLLNDTYIYLQRIQTAMDITFFRRPELDQAKLTATIIDDWTIQNLVQQNHGPSRRVAVKLFGDLWIGCLPNVTAAPNYVVQKDLDRFEISAEDAVALCEKNTMATQPPFAQAIRDVAPGEVGMLNGNNEAVLILFHDQWGIVASRFDGALILSVPDADTILYTRNSGPLAIQALVDRTKSVRGRKLPIVAPSVYRWTTAGWDIVYPAK